MTETQAKELTSLDLYDEQEAQRIVELIDASQKVSTRMTGPVYVDVSRGSALVYRVWVGEDFEDSVLVFERTVFNDKNERQEVFKPGMWITHLEALPEKLRKQDEDYDRRQEERRISDLKAAFAPIDDAAIFAEPEPRAASPVPVEKPTPLSEVELVYGDVGTGTGLDQLKVELSALRAKGYKISNVAPFSFREPTGYAADYALFTLMLEDN